jgi:ABC-type polysaccharide/polyol phosphate export permease
LHPQLQADSNPIHAFPDPRVLLRQVLALARASLAARYRRTWAGFLWVLMAPIIQFGVQLTVFHGLFKTPLGEYSAFLLSGLLPWLFLAQTLEMCTPILVNSTGLMRSLSIHPITYVLAQVLDNLINFLIVFLTLLGTTILLGWVPLRSLVLLPVPMLCLALTAISLSWLLATLNVFYRDTRFVLSFSLSLGFFLTPIFYRKEQIPVEWLARLIELNPVWQIIRPFQIALSRESLPIFAEASLRALGVSVVIGAVSLYQWRRKRNELYFNL